MSFYEAETQWHEGEEALHRLLRVPEMDNPTQPYLTPHAGAMLIRAPLVAIGTLDAEGRPWTTLLGGEPGFARAIAQSIIGIKTTVDGIFDPVLEVLLGDKADGEVVQVEGVGKMVGGVAIDLETRRRVKLYGRMVAGALSGTGEGIGEAQLVVKIEQSLGNCPKYLNKKRIIPSIPKPQLVSTNLPLSQLAIELIEASDLFFISSSHHESDMDTNHRGGPPGFVRILSNSEDSCTLVYPEYSGNRFYQTLGNLQTTPKAGLVFPNFRNGDVLYVTGGTEILTGKDASNLIAHTNVAVKIEIQSARCVLNGLAFRGQEGEFSPYNPQVRYLSNEHRQGLESDSDHVMAKLVDKKIIAPTIGRFRFQMTESKSGSKWKPGQYVVLSFQEELDIGYSHMRDDDPKSLNDDFTRTFTVSSRQDDMNMNNSFEITIRNVGVATNFLFRHNVRAKLELPVHGFGGEFFLRQDKDENIAFIAGGVGITPLLAQAKDLVVERLQFYWTVKGEDLSFVCDTFARVPQLEKATKLFVTGNVDEDSTQWKKLLSSGLKMEKRRMLKEDMAGDEANQWYICTAPGFRATLLTWLDGKNVSFEDFNY